jgi:pimeloyl-ACP methyl ester carboxylesterase
VALSPEPFEVSREGMTLRGDVVGSGPSIVLVHGLSATRRYVLHGSKLLARQGFRLVSYDARGHGESDPAPPGAGYSFDELADDLDAVLAHTDAGRPLLAGHSMGSHTILAWALRDPDRVAGLVVVGPVFMGTPLDEGDRERWDELAAGLEEGGVDGFMRAYETRELDPAYRETVLKFTRQRISAHRHPDAVARALREVPRSRPYDSLAELEFLDAPTLVVASRDEADPSHPYSVAEAYAERIPGARLVSEAPGESPLAWQGSRLSREIAAFCTESAVAGRLV